VNATVLSRRAETPKTYYGREDLIHFAERGRLDAALSFGLEMQHVESCRKHYYRLTAPGMLFVEQQGWAAMEEDI
jgi:hypothetical protein